MQHFNRCRNLLDAHGSPAHSSRGAGSAAEGRPVESTVETVVVAAKAERSEESQVEGLMAAGVGGRAASEG